MSVPLSVIAQKYSLRSTDVLSVGSDALTTLAGIHSTLQKTTAVYLEAQQDQGVLNEIDILLINYGFKRVEPVLYIRQPLTNIPVYVNDPAFVNTGYNNSTMAVNGEVEVVKKLIPENAVVFDVGANVGEWSRYVLDNKPTVQLYAFEPIPTVYDKLRNNLLKTSCHNLAISDKNGSQPFFHYNSTSTSSELSGLYHRPLVDQMLGAVPIAITVQTKTLDTFCSEKEIHRIDFLKIDTEGAELSVLKGASNLLHNHLVTMIQFEYGGTYTDSNTTLKQVYDLLRGYGYTIYRIIPSGFVWVTTWDDSLENYSYSNWLATISV